MENIASIIETVVGFEAEYHVLVVDDGSPDGTAEIVEGLMPKHFGRIFIEKNSGYTVAHLGGVVPNSIVWGDWRSHYFGLVKPVVFALGGICDCYACDSLCRDDFVICLFHAKQFQRTGRH